MKNAVLWDITQCHYCKQDVSEERGASIIMFTSIGELVPTLAITNNRRTLRRNTTNVPSSPILVTLMMVALRSFQTSVLTISILRNIPEARILRI
jgi:hypothetical protein